MTDGISPKMMASLTTCGLACVEIQRVVSGKVPALLARGEAEGMMDGRPLAAGPRCNHNCEQLEAFGDFRPLFKQRWYRAYH